MVSGIRRGYTRYTYRATQAAKLALGTRMLLWGGGFGGAVVRALATSKVAGSILIENFLNVTQCSAHVKRVKSQHSAESRRFSPSTPVSFHREVDRVG